MILKRLASRLVENGVSILQYADDTILLLEDDLEQARNLKFILYLFKQMLGLKINFHKSEVICLENSSYNFLMWPLLFLIYHVLYISGEKGGTFVRLVQLLHCHR